VGRAFAVCRAIERSRLDRALSVRLVFIAAAVLLPASCARSTQTAVHYERVSATSQIDKAHRLAITVHLFSGSAPAGLTPLQIEVKDSRAEAVGDAVVYVETDSETGETPKMTLLAGNDNGDYRVNLPLVYGSHWTFTVKAFSSRRSGIVNVEEQL
jgi:hypothetical protein